MATTRSVSRRATALLRWTLTAAILAGGFVASTSAVPANAAAVTAGAGQAGTGSYAYGWPVKPFFRQHPVRAFFGDPRIAGHGIRPGTRSFHGGVDVSAPDGTPVYATVDGTALIDDDHPEVVWVRAADGSLFGYWHVDPTARRNQRVVAYRTQLGTIASGWGHVHFSEERDGVLVNPLRPRAMGPYADGTVPRIRSIVVERLGRTLAAKDVAGRVDLVVIATDETPIPVPGAWRGKPVTPAVIRWRVIDSHGSVVVPWRTAWDVGHSVPRNAEYDRFYARWTRQNKAKQWGRYRFVLVRGWDVEALAPGIYAVEVTASDTRRNTVTSRLPLAVSR